MEKLEMVVEREVDKISEKQTEQKKFNVQSIKENRLADKVRKEMKRLEEEREDSTSKVQFDI